MPPAPAAGPPPGRLITLEGGEGAGKSTQAALLAAALAAAGLPVLRTREPGGSPGAEALRRFLLEGDARLAPAAEVLAHFAARADHVARTIRPCLAAGLWVVCDRFADSTMAYQGDGLGADRATIAGLTDMLGLTPDLTLVLDVPDAVAASRLAARGARPDRYEALGADFHRRARAGFLAIARAAPVRCQVVAADGTVADVARSIAAAVAARFGVALSSVPQGGGPHAGA